MSNICPEQRPWLRDRDLSLCAVARTDPGHGIDHAVPWMGARVGRSAVTLCGIPAWIHAVNGVKTAWPLMAQNACPGCTAAIKHQQ